MEPHPTIDPVALVKAAQQARQNAYAPYSHYHVGAALLTSDGTIFTGCNVENAAYPATICAERVAISKAISEGQQGIIALAVATENGGAPCGICRQVMAEFSPDLTLVIFIADAKGMINTEYTLGDLLPLAFTPAALHRAAGE